MKKRTTRTTAGKRTANDRKPDVAEVLLGTRAFTTSRRWFTADECKSPGCAKLAALAQSGRLLIKTASELENLTPAAFIEQAVVSVAKKTIQNAFRMRAFESAPRGIKGTADARIADAIERLRQNGQPLTANAIKKIAATCQTTIARFLVKHKYAPMPWCRGAGRIVYQYKTNP